MSVVVPTFNEADNIAELVTRIAAATQGMDVEIVFVDDSVDETPAVIREVAASASLPVRLIHRDAPLGGLSGAVVEGMKASDAEWIVVMDGDLQHPPEVVPLLVRSGIDNDVDVVVASRHVSWGSSDGLDGWFRHLASTGAKVLTRSMFPLKLRNCTDPMTGFFAVRRATVDLDALRPQGFKILLEVLARSTHSVHEEPFVFAARTAGESKATARQGLRFLSQLISLRFGKLSGFAVVGALGAVANLLIMAALQAMGVWYVAAAIVAAVITIVGNFVLQERLVFSDLRAGAGRARTRFARSFAFNAVETAVRTGLLWVIVETTVVPSLLAQAVLILGGFVLRFVYHSRIVYRPQAAPTGTGLDSELTSLTQRAHRGEPRSGDDLAA